MAIKTTFSLVIYYLKYAPLWTIYILTKRRVTESSFWSQIPQISVGDNGGLTNEELSNIGEPNFCGLNCGGCGTLDIAPSIRHVDSKVIYLFIC